MATEWTYANTIIQYSQHASDIAWVDNGTGFWIAKYPNGSFLETVNPLLHIANTLVKDIKNYTYFLQFTGFQFTNLPTTISGVEANLSMNRGGRVTDEVIQLTYNGVAIGQNKADFNLAIDKTYGAPTDTWQYNLTHAILSDPTFGIIVKFQSHPYWPHRSTPGIDYIRLRVS